jgi:protein-tyrosine phosphatase
VRDLFESSGRPRDPRPDDHVVQIVVVCTGNVARSPLAMAMLEHEARRRLGPDAPVWVSSSGVHGLDGARAVAEARTQAEHRGIDLGHHRGSVTDGADVERADLVLTMTEAQRALVLRRGPRASRHVFTLLEFARLLGGVDPAQLPSSATPRARVRAAVAAAHGVRAHIPRPAAAEDVDDPYGLPMEVYDELGRRFDDLIPAVAETLFGPVTGRGSDPSSWWGAHGRGPPSCR